MPHVSASQVERFNRESHLAGLDALSPGEVASYRDALMRMHEHFDEALHRYFINLHAVLPWADRLARHPEILDAVSGLLGPDLRLWKSKAFVKFPGVGTVNWNQDVPHWDILPARAVTAWVALSDVDEANGCVRVLPGSHREGPRPASQDTTSALLSAGLTCPVTAEEAARSTPILLRAGQFSLHDGMVIHASGANHTAAPRIGLALIYIAADTIQNGPAHEHVPVVRGEARTSFYPVAPRPTGNDNDALDAAGRYFEKFRQGAVKYNVY